MLKKLANINSFKFREIETLEKGVKFVRVSTKLLRINNFVLAISYVITFIMSNTFGDVFIGWIIYDSPQKS